MNTNILDGFSFNLPLDTQQVRDLAKYHRNQLNQAIYHEDEHIGEIGIIQRAKIATFVQNLEPMVKQQFYTTYNDELKKLAVDDPIHPPHAEKGVSIFVLLVALVIIAGVLYFNFVVPINALK